MKVEIKNRVAPNIDSMFTERTRIIFRCVDCQTFLLPDMIHMAYIRFRDKETGQGRTIPVEVCPVCYDGIGSPEYEKSLTVKDEVPHSTFITLTRHQYEQTKKAEQWGLVYDPQTDKMRSNLLVH